MLVLQSSDLSKNKFSDSSLDFSPTPVATLRKRNAIGNAVKKDGRQIRFGVRLAFLWETDAVGNLL